jgi:hypothetical protein
MSVLRYVTASVAAAILLATLTASSAHAFFPNYGPRPQKWCGWQMRQEVWRDPGPAFNRAIEWKKYGSVAHGPAVGVIVVWRNHVGKIVGRDDRGNWIVRSGNDGRALRERARSLRGVLAYRWP